jgi:hypothetical protein
MDIFVFLLLYFLAWLFGFIGGVRYGYALGWINCLFPTQKSEDVALREMSKRHYSFGHEMIVQLPFFAKWFRELPGTVEYLPKDEHEEE